MLSMQELGYLLYMEECDRQYEEEQRLKYKEVNIDSEEDLEAEKATYTKNQRFI